MQDANTRRLGLHFILACISGIRSIGRCILRRRTVESTLQRIIRATNVAPRRLQVTRKDRTARSRITWRCRSCMDCVQPRLLFKNTLWKEICGRIAARLQLTAGDVLYATVQEQTDQLMNMVLSVIHELTSVAKPSPYAKRWWTSDLTSTPTGGIGKGTTAGSGIAANSWGERHGQLQRSITMLSADSKRRTGTSSSMTTTTSGRQRSTSMPTTV